MGIRISRHPHVGRLLRRRRNIRIKKKVLDRIAGQQLHWKLKRGDIIIVTRIHRICRNLHDFTTMLDRWERDRVGFVCCDDPVDTSNKSPFGKFVVQLIGAVAELESGLIAERTAESHAVRRKAGLVSGPHPVMYEWGRDRKLHVHMGDLEAGELFYRMHVDQKISTCKISMWAWKKKYYRKKKRGNRHQPDEFSDYLVIKLIELYRRYLWLTERGVDVFGREYLDLTAKQETPMRLGNPAPKEMLDDRSFERMKAAVAPVAIDYKSGSEPSSPSSSSNSSV